MASERHDRHLAGASGFKFAPQDGTQKQCQSNDKVLEEKLQRIQIRPERTGWGKLADLFHKNDQQKIQDAKEDIDTLLVFAGLFSAVLTAFFIESTKTLQQQPEDTTNQLLAQISMQLSSLATTGSVSPPVQPSITLPFTPSSPSVRVNTLWSLSLVTALFTASLAILVKQWLHEFMAQTTMDPMEQVKLRIFRYEGVKDWRVFELAASLPMLLQLALLLFFIGFSEFLRELNPVVGWITTTWMLFWLVVYIFATFAPVFSSQCPYKTLVLKPLLSALRIASVNATHSVLKKLPEGLQLQRIYSGAFLWIRRSEYREEHAIRKETRSHMAILAFAEDALQGERLRDTILQCSRNCVIELDQLDECIASSTSKPSLNWLPPLHSGIKSSMSQLYLDIIGDDSGPHSNLNMGIDLNPSYEHLTFVVHNALLTGSQSMIESLQMAIHKLVQSGRENALMVFLSVHCAMCRVVSSDHVEWDFSIMSNCIQHHTTRSGYMSEIVDTTTFLLRRNENPEATESAPRFDWIADKCKSWGTELSKDPIILTFIFSQLSYCASQCDREAEEQSAFLLMKELAQALERHKVEGGLGSVHRTSLKVSYTSLQALDMQDERLTRVIRDLDPYIRR